MKGDQAGAAVRQDAVAPGSQTGVRLSSQEAANADGEHRADLRRQGKHAQRLAESLPPPAAEYLLRVRRNHHAQASPSASGELERAVAWVLAETSARSLVRNLIEVHEVQFLLTPPWAGGTDEEGRRDKARGARARNT
jgi:hypothetical protein